MLTSVVMVVQQVCMAPHIVIYNSLMKKLLREENVLESALELMEEIQDQGIKPDEVIPSAPAALCPVLTSRVVRPADLHDAAAEVQGVGAVAGV
eukprot:2631240-Rhodomonas_salina.2